MELDFLNENRKMLIGLLSAAIRGKTYRPAYSTCIDWQIVFDEAVQHQVLPLVYPLLAEIVSSISVSETLLEKWRKNALCQGMGQERNYDVIVKVLEQYANAGISVIVLKGMVLRELYPHPCFRTMGDVDLLVKPGDIDRAGRMLVEAGYRMYSDNGKHTEYLHEILPCIELHRSMARDGYFEKSNDFKTEVWKSAITVNLNGVRMLSLCPQDKILYLSMHMASHIISSGFGLRQLCDFVLFIETYENEIDWIKFFRMAALCHIDTFVNVLLEGCHILFDMELPEVCKEYELHEISLVRSFIEDILDGGVFGKNSIERITANRLLFYTDGSEAKSMKQKLMGFISMLFPKAAKLDIRYDYARNHKYLLPAAWIHRIFYVIVRRDMDFAEKTAVLTSRAPASICSSRSAMLRQLGLLD